MRRSWAAVALLAAMVLPFVSARAGSRTVAAEPPRPSPTDQSPSPSPSPTPTYTPVPPDVTPAYDDFGTVCVGTDSPASTFTIQNPDPVQDLVVQSITVTWPFVAGHPAESTVPPGESTTFTVTYRPDASGPASSTVDIATSNGPASVTVSGNGLDRQVSVAPTTLAFGGQLPKTASAPRAITIANTGTDPLSVESPAVGGSDPAAFQLAATPAFVLPGNTAKRLTVVFAPSADGDVDATITIGTNACVGALRTIVLTGSGAHPGVTAHPDSLELAAAPGKKSEPVVLTVASTGGVPLHISSIVLTGTGAPSFALAGLPHFPATLAPGDTMQLKLTFAAAKPETQPPPAATIEIASDDPKMPVLSVGATGVYVTPSPSPSPSPTGTPKAVAKTARPGGGLSGYTSVLVVALLVAGAFVGLWVLREEKMRRALRRVAG